MTRLKALACLTGVVLLASSAVADVVATSDGSRFVGTIKSLAEGKLVIETEVAGAVTIDAATLTGIETSEAINVEFASGDRLVGPVSSGSGDSAGVVRTSLGEIPIPNDGLAAIWPVGADSPEVVAMKAETERIREELTPKWDITLEAGGSFTEGNTETLKGHGRFDVERETKEDLLSFFLAAQYAETSDVRTENEYTGGVLYENTIDDPWFWYSRLQLEYDEFENLDLRATASAGVGYHWIKKDDHRWKTRLGLGYRHESFNDGSSKDQGTIELGSNYRIDLSPYTRFTQVATYSPGIEEFEDYRLSFDTAFVFPFPKDKWKLKVGMKNDYNSRPQRGIERLDNLYYANIVLDLK